MTDCPLDKDPSSLRHQLIQTISSKKDCPMMLSKTTLSFKEAELTLTEKIPEGLLSVLLEFQQECLQQKIPPVHSYFVTQWLVSNSDKPQLVQTERSLLKGKKSTIQSLRGCIQMRQHLLGKINQFTGNSLKALFEDIDDIRFLNFQIIGLVSKWKEQWRTNDSEPVLLEEGKNYLLKMANDNADLINIANFKKTKFISPPNPFFLSEDGNLTSMSPQQQQDIQHFLAQLSKERSLMLKITLEGTPFSSPHPKPLKRGRKDQKGDKSIGMVARQQIEKSKVEEIRNIYSIKSSLSSAKLKAQRQTQSVRKMATHQKPAGQAIVAAYQKRSSSMVARETKKKQIKDQQIRRDSSSSKVLEVYGRKTKTSQKSFAKKKIQEMSSKEDKKIGQNEKQLKEQKRNNAEEMLIKPNSKVSSRPGSLRGTIDKALQTMKDKSRSDSVRHLKPKIKLIEEKETVTDQNQIVKSVLDLGLSLPPKNIKNSTFYKRIQPIEEVQQYSEVKPKMAASTMLPFPLNIKPSIPESRQIPVAEVRRMSSVTAKSGRKMGPGRSESAINRSSVRDLPSNLKNLTIINIYRGDGSKKKKKQKSLSHSLLKDGLGSPGKKIQESAITEKLMKQSSQELVNSRLSAVLQKEKQRGENQVSKLSQQLLSKSQLVHQQELALKQKEQSRKEMEEELTSKSKTIEELEFKIKEIQQKKKEYDSPHRKNDKKTPKRDLSDLEREKKRGQIENKVLQEKIRAEQTRLSVNREKELRLKQAELQRELKATLKQTEKEHQEKMKQFQNQLKAEERRLKQIEKSIVQERHKQGALENQLSQKKLKEQLLKKILNQKEAQLNQLVSGNEEESAEMARRAQLQLEQAEQAERENLAAMEEEHARMEQMYQDLLRKNQMMEEENRRKSKEIEENEQRRQIQKSRQQEEQKQIRQKLMEKQTYLEDQPSEPSVTAQELREKIKQELLAELLQRQEEERLQEEREEERKRERLRHIQSEVAASLKAEELKLEQENKQFLERLDEMKKKHQLSLLRIQRQEESILNEDGEDKEGTEGREEKKFTESLKSEKEEKENEQKNQEKQGKQQKQVKEDKKQKQEAKENPAQELLSYHGELQPVTHQLVAEGRQKQMPVSQLGDSEPQKMEITSALVQESDPVDKVKDKSSINKVMNQAEQTSNEPSRESILQKYAKLKSTLKKCQPLFLEDYNLSLYLDTFLGSFESTLRAMLPSKIQLGKNILSKGGDIWDCNSIGWIDKPGRYTLVGSLSCLGSIGNKYGKMQIQQQYLFDRTNLYQKQMMAKKIKEHQHVGWVMQRKTKSPNLFSIRFIVEIPEEVAGPSVQFGTFLTSRLVKENHLDNQPDTMQRSSFSFLAGSFAKQHLEGGQLKAMEQSSNPFSRALLSQLANKEQLASADCLKVEEGLHPSLTFQTNFPVIRFKNQLFYRLDCHQLEDDDLTRYFKVEVEGGVSLIFQSQREATSPIILDRKAELVISHLNLAKKVRQVQLLVPIWEYSQKNNIQIENVSSVLKEEVRAQVGVPSVGTTQLEGEWSQLQPPFLCLLVQQARGLVVRHLQGHEVVSQQIRFRDIK